MIVEPVAGSTGVVVPPIGYLQRLRQIGVHDAQGYHLHRPEPFEQLLAEAMAKRAG